MAKDWTPADISNKFPLYADLHCYGRVYVIVLSVKTDAEEVP